MGWVTAPFGLAQAAGPSATVETIDRFRAHVELIRKAADRFGLSERVASLEGEGESILHGLTGPYDFIHDDGWFGKEPPYYDCLGELLRPGGLLVMSNWFLLEHAVTGESPVDWSQFAGDSWADQVRAYAGRLMTDPRWEVAFVPRPPVALALRVHHG